MKNLNKLALLSLLALLGVLGIVTPNKGFLGFFGFLVYLRYLWVVPDEMFTQMFYKAGSAGFFGGIAVTIPAIFLAALYPDVFKPVYTFVTNFAGSILAFTITLFVLEYKERRGM